MECKFTLAFDTILPLINFIVYNGVILPIPENEQWEKVTLCSHGQLSTHKFHLPPTSPHLLHMSHFSHGLDTETLVKPDHVVKVDDDSFIMLAELEARPRLELHAAKPRRPDFYEANSTDTTSAISMLLPYHPISKYPSNRPMIS